MPVSHHVPRSCMGRANVERFGTNEWDITQKHGGPATFAHSVIVPDKADHFEKSITNHTNPFSNISAGNRCQSIAGGTCAVKHAWDTQPVKPRKPRPGAGDAK